MEWVSSSMWEVLVWQLPYLSGALDVISGICEVVVCLFFTHWLQLQIQHSTSLLRLHCRDMFLFRKTYHGWITEWASLAQGPHVLGTPLVSTYKMPLKGTCINWEKWWPQRHMNDYEETQNDSKEIQTTTKRCKKVAKRQRRRTATMKWCKTYFKKTKNNYNDNETQQFHRETQNHKKRVNNHEVERGEGAHCLVIHLWTHPQPFPFQTVSH